MKEKTTIVIWKETSKKVRTLAKRENRSVSAQIDYMLTKSLAKEKSLKK